MGNLNFFNAEFNYYCKNKIVNKLIKRFENKRLFNPLQLSIYTLKDWGLWPKSPIVLDAFSQMGLQWTRVFSNEASFLEMWEINPASVVYAKKEFPNANVICGDSIEAFKNKGFSRSDFNFILLDAPLPYQFADKSFEHFGFFNDIFKSAGNECVIIFNVVPDIRKMLSRYPKTNDFVNLWKEARTNFYNVTDGEIVSIETMINAYTQKVSDMGYKLKYINYGSRNIYFGFITMVVAR